MKKRSKIIALVTTLCLCLSMFVVGVLAATSATFNVTSTLNFTADGVYVMVDASLKQGADVANAAVLSGEDKPTGQTTYKAYSYPRETNQDYPNGEPSTTYFVNEDGAQADTWAIGDINYTSTNKVVVYEFTVSNYSPFEVQGTVSGISEALATYIEQGQLTIATYTGTTSSSATATGSPTYSFTIPARTNETTPGQACYKIAVTLNNFMNNLATSTIEMNVSFDEYEPDMALTGIIYTGANHAVLAPTDSNGYSGVASVGSNVTWENLQASLTSANRAVKYRMEVTNNTEAGISGVGEFTITDQTTPEPSLVAGGVNTYEFTNYTVTEYAQYIQNIQPNDTQVYELVVELNEGASSATINLSISFDFTDNTTYSITWNSYTYNYVNMGHYPQRYVGNTMNAELEALLQSNDTNLAETGIIYTTFNDCNLPTSTSATDATPILVESKEYTYIDGNTYVRMESPDFQNNLYTYMNGERMPVNIGARYPAQWYKVEPIQWRVLTDNYNSTGSAMLLSEMALSANTSFYPTDSTSYGDITNYARTDNPLRNFLTVYFYNQALTSEEQAKVIGRDFAEGELEYNGVDEENVISELLDQKVWLLTMADYINGDYGFDTNLPSNFVQDPARMCSPSDFALANHAHIFVDSGYTTPVRQNGCTTVCWTSSSMSPDSSFVSYVDYTGYVVYDYVYYEEFAVRPALLFKL